MNFDNHFYSEKKFQLNLSTSHAYFGNYFNSRMFIDVYGKQKISIIIVKMTTCSKVQKSISPSRSSLMSVSDCLSIKFAI